MIVLRVVRVEDGSFSETELGEVRLADTGAGVYSHLSTAEGGPVIAHVVERLGVATPEAVRQSRGAAAPFLPRESFAERLRREGRCEGCGDYACRCGMHT